MNKFDQERNLRVSRDMSVTYHSGGHQSSSSKERFHLSLQKNKMLGIIGETGSGKSSLIRASERI